ncbi:unnamed protein product [Strongylus vulgaris]|uniref:Receptor ligand binding region domain-containing protein n=1 Tax=Strongylus vulgaris TaxID=40348 RepID=A0A3P7JNU3_STRVU|nr:unnamed protein product [Strongylus vulgaris]
MLMDTKANMTITYSRQLQNYTYDTFKNVLKAIKSVSRVTVVCLESAVARRNMYIAIAEEGMNTNDYVYLLLDNRKLGFRFSGTVIINENLTRNPVFLVYGLDSVDKQIVLMQIAEDLENKSVDLIQELQPPSVVWANHGGSVPLNRPRCDFDGSACPASFIEQYLVIIIAAVVVPIIIAATSVFFLLRLP